MNAQIATLSNQIKEIQQVQARQMVPLHTLRALNFADIYFRGSRGFRGLLEKIKFRGNLFSRSLLKKIISRNLFSRIGSEKLFKKKIAGTYFRGFRKKKQTKNHGNLFSRI